MQKVCAHTNTHTFPHADTQFVKRPRVGDALSAFITVWLRMFLLTKNLQFPSACITIGSLPFLSIHVPHFNALPVQGLSTSVEAKSGLQLSETAY